ncbi:MAG: TIGR03016 family PEP-CTERM system-associated outer membrane protein [Pseudorhodoferax sp.]
MQFLRPPFARESGLVQALVVAGLFGAASVAHGQTTSNRLSSAPSEPLSARQTAAEGNEGNGQNDRRQMSLVPRVSVEGTWTDNVRARAGAAKEADFVTSVTPGLRFTAEGDRLKANVDYSLTRQLHARERSLDRNQNALRALGSLEMADNFAFVDFTGNISQQTISAFGTRSGSDVTDNPNRTEVAQYRVSPYVRGRFGDWSQYELRYGRTAARTKSSLVAADYDLDDLSLRLASTSQQRVIGWSLDATHQKQEYASGRLYESDRVRAFLTHPFTPQLSVSVIPGWESNNYASADKESHATFGGQVQWTLSERTRFSALLENRFFGRAYNVNFEHRTPRSAWRFSDSRDASSTPSQAGAFSVGTLYDLYFFQFTSLEPDPARRAQLVNSFLLANGLDGNTSVDLGFLSSSVTLTRRRDASFTLIGLRDTLSFSVSQSETSRLRQVTADTGEDLGTSNYVRQHGLSVVYSRRLTPQSSLSVLGSMSRAAGEQGSGQTRDMHSLNISLSTKLGPHTTGTLGLRRTLSSGTLSSYSESALRGGLSLQF